jgi:hypothetical protein
MSMEESLIHEMAHTATDGSHGDAWHAEMDRLQQLGAPVWEGDLGRSWEPYKRTLSP